MATMHQPRSLEEVCSLLESLEEPMVYGGGTAIQILAKQGVLFAENLVDLSWVPGLSEIEEHPDGVRAGPMVTVRRMETDPLVRRRLPLAAQTYGRVANPRVRNTASVGGNVAHGDYRLDPATALLVHDAVVELTSVHGRRRVRAREFYVDFQATAARPNEVVTSIDWPTVPAAAGSAFVKMTALGANDWPAASVASMRVRAAGRDVLRLALGALAPTPRYTEVDVTDLAAEAAAEAAVEALTPLMDPIPDVRGGAAYKKALGVVAAQDAVRLTYERAQDG